MNNGFIVFSQDMVAFQCQLEQLKIQTIENSNYWTSEYYVTLTVRAYRESAVIFIIVIIIFLSLHIMIYLPIIGFFYAFAWWQWYTLMYLKCLPLFLDNDRLSFIVLNHAASFWVSLYPVYFARAIWSDINT